jgi:hypothetical protein
MTTLKWKDKVNTRGAWSFTARAPHSIGGNYVISQFMCCWNIDYHKRKPRTQRQLGFACTIEEAEAIAQADNDKVIQPAPVKRSRRAKAVAETDYEAANKGQ